MEEYVYDPLAGFHFVHDIYIELCKLGYDLRTLYDYSVKELLFILKYRREGLAYKIWRQGTMSRAARAKEFPGSEEKAMPELFEKKTVNINQLPEEFRINYVKNLQKELNKKYTAR